MVATPDPQVYDLGHLGLVASTVDRVGASTVHVGSLGRAGGASCWSSTQLHITRPRCASWWPGDITCWSEGGAECGLDRSELKPLEREAAMRILGSSPHIRVSFHEVFAFGKAPAEGGSPPL